MRLRCLIVEDEPLALERARTYAAKVPYIDVVAALNNGPGALRYLQQHPVDLLLLDIHLGELSGIQLLESVQVNAAVILTTAYPEYALKGYDLAVTDYLLKPYNFQRFLQAVDRAHEQLKHRTMPERDYIFIKVEHRQERVNLNELLYIEGMRDYRRLHLTDRRIMTLMTFRELEELIPAQAALRVHKSWMVSLGKIDRVERDRVIVGDRVIPVSDSYRNRLREAISPGATLGT